MITRSLIAFEGWLASSIAPQILPPCDYPKVQNASEGLGRMVLGKWLVTNQRLVFIPDNQFAASSIPCCYRTFYAQHSLLAWKLPLQSRGNFSKCNHVILCIKGLALC